MSTINKPFRKKDAMQLVTGQPVYMDDVIPQDCLIVKLLRSPHANAIVKTINTAVAKKVPGIEAIFTWEDVPQDAPRYTQAGQTYPEASPRDRLLIDRHVRFVGDVVAIVAGKDEKCVDKALKLIKVEYEVLEAVLDYHTAKDNPILVHPEDNWASLCPVGADNKRNLCAHDECGAGDIDAVLAASDVVIDHIYHTKACQQAMMETFRTYCSIDTYGRLNVLSSTQIVFHARRNIANALHIPKSMVRVAKPRVGGGFGAKQTAVSEVYPAFVTWKTKKPSKIIFSRVESQTASSPRHEMEMHVRLGATKDGIVKGIDLYTLSNTGAYGEHGPTTVGLSGHKSIPLYGKAEAFRFVSDVVYTNHMSAGAYRGSGATQGLFAVESAVNELAHKLNMDPFELRLKNTVQEGDVMPAYYGAVNTSCALDRCLVKVREMIDWEHKYPARDLGNGKVRAVGMGTLRDILAAEPEKSLSGGRAVYGFAWYFAALADDGAPLREGGSCEILFDGFEKSTAAEIISVSAAENGQCALLLRLTASSPEYLSLRRSGAEIIFSRYSGLELPLEAVHTDGERNNFVYISTAGIVRSLDVDIIYTDKAGGFCLAAQDASFDALREGNTVIVSGKDIYEGKVLG